MFSVQLLFTHSIPTRLISPKLTAPRKLVSVMAARRRRRQRRFGVIAGQNGKKWKHFPRIDENEGECGKSRFCVCTHHTRPPPLCNSPAHVFIVSLIRRQHFSVHALSETQRQHQQQQLFMLFVKCQMPVCCCAFSINGLITHNAFLKTNFGLLPPINSDKY